MSGEKKRKRADHDEGRRSEKKASTKHAQSDTVKVSFRHEEDEWTAAVANTPGFSIPSNISLQPYRKARKDGTASVGKSALHLSEHLLHGSAHPKLDFVGREEGEGGANRLLNHYIGVYDPRSGQLELVRARKLVLRGSVRPTQASLEKAASQINGLSARNNLGLTFGTKKSQKAIESLTRNAISTSTSHPTASAVLSSMTSAGPTREELQAAVDESKPRPKPNLSTDNPAEIYPIDQLVGPGTLAHMTIKGWQDTIEAGEPILTKSRFVSNRVQSIVQSGDIRRLKTLKYLLLLLEWHSALIPSTSPKNPGRKVLPPEKLHQQLTGWSSSLVDGVSHRFAEGGRTLTRWHLDNVITHVCALAVTVDKLACNVYDLGQDLKLDGKETRKYFREIGAQVGPPTDAEMKRERWVKKHVVARLRVPLMFPKMKVLGGKRRK